MEDRVLGCICIALIRGRGLTERRSCSVMSRRRPVSGRAWRQICWRIGTISKPDDSVRQIQRRGANGGASECEQARSWYGCYLLLTFSKCSFPSGRDGSFPEWQQSMRRRQPRCAFCNLQHAVSSTQPSARFLCCFLTAASRTDTRLIVSGGRPQAG